MPADANETTPEFFAKLQPGSKLAGCYLLKKRVAGPAQPLWLAHDEVLDKDIALHFLPLGLLARSGVAERLRPEVKRARQLVHPRVLRVQELIEEEEWAAVATDPFSSQPLAAVISENTHGFFEVAEVWPLVRELCETLDSAHQLHFVHGGISPEDVLVGEGQAKLMNFGVSACVRGATEEMAKSPFVSPQQLGGAVPTAADDVFALGAVLHTLLAGAPPFEGANRQAALSIAEHRRKLNHRGGEVPGNWESVIASCLAEDPAERPSSCGEIARQLEASATAPAPVPVAAAPVAPAVEPVIAAPPPQPEPVTPPVVVSENVIEVEKKEEQPAAAVPAIVPEEPKVAAEKPAKAEASVARVDQVDLAEKVRREEAQAEARRLGGDDDGESFSASSTGSGPSLLTLIIIIAFVALVGFILYRAFFADASPRPERSVVDVSLSTPIPTPKPTPVLATPTPVAVVKIPPSTPTPAPFPPLPTPVSTPKSMAQNNDPKLTAPIAELESAITEIKQAREKVSKDLPVSKKAADDLGAQQQKLAEELKKAEAAAQEAEKAVADRKKTAEDARKAATTAAEQLAMKKSEIAKAEEHVVKLDLYLKDKEKALLDTKVAFEAAKRRETEAARPGMPEKPSVGATPVSTATPRPAASPIPDNPRQAFEEKMKELSKVLSATPAPNGKQATPAPESVKPAVELAKATTPAPLKSAKSGGEGLMNSLGMRLVPLPGSDVLVCIWPTRVRDFEVFAKATGLKSMLWKDPGFKQGADHPVVNVTWQEAMAFCKWLTIKEQKDGTISANQSYRLLTDLEWSRGAGLGAESGNTPESRDMGVPDSYPWGSAWPPPTGAGNYTGEETGSDVAIKGYNDGFAWTSPVGSFPPNKLGLFDMGGNVWQWCMDSWNAESKAKVLRGASWYNGALKLSLLTSCRVHASPDSSTDNYGFRIVLAGQTDKAGR